jgi:CRP/FNR family transcriptional regulator
VSNILQNNSCVDCFFKSRLFDSLTDDELNLISLKKKQLKFKKGDLIYSEGEKVENFIYLQKGLVKVNRKVNVSSNRIISISQPKDFVGFLSVLSNDYHLYSITAVEDAVACLIPIDIIKSIIKNNSEFSLKVLEYISNVNEDLLKMRIDLSSRQLRGRIAYILLYFSDRVYKNTVFDLPISRKEIAELIAMTTENVIRILSEFKKDGIITIEGKTINIIDKSRLLRISDLG